MGPSASRSMRYSPSGSAGSRVSNSRQLAALTQVLAPSQRPVAQSVVALQAWPAAQGAREPPQSTALSSWLRIPLLQEESWQALVQASVSTSLASSQASPAAALITPSPHSARVQSALQLSDSPASSQASPAAALSTPSPHWAGV